MLKCLYPGLTTVLLSSMPRKHMFFGRGRVKGASHPLYQPLMINGQTMETVSTFKYLGTVADENLTFTDNVDHLYEKAQQRLFLVRKLRNFNVSTYVLQLIYTSLIESVLSFMAMCLSRTKQGRLGWSTTRAKLFVIKQLKLCGLYQQTLRRKAVQIHSSTQFCFLNSPVWSTTQNAPCIQKLLQEIFSHKHIEF